MRERDEAFAAAWGEAVEAGTQRLEDEALRRAVEGYDEETFDGGGILVRRVRRYDSALLQQLLKARRPEMYRESVPATPSVTIVLREYRLGEGPEVDGKPGIIEGQARELPAGKPAS